MSKAVVAPPRAVIFAARGISEITWAVNSTPIKCLGHKTPAEALLENLRCCT